MADFEFGDTPQALSAWPAGNVAGVIHSLLGERSFGSRVANLGFTVGARISVRQNYCSWPDDRRGATRHAGGAGPGAEAAKVLVQMES